MQKKKKKIQMLEPQMLSVQAAKPTHNQSWPEGKRGRRNYSFLKPRAKLKVKIIPPFCLENA